MMKILRSVVLLVLLSGCAPLSEVIPEGYVGDTASIDDSFERLSGSKANLYYISRVDGNAILNAYNSSSAASSHNGLKISLRGTSRALPIRTLKLHLAGVVAHGAPIGYVFGAGSNYYVEGEVSFTPEAGARYLVSGKLSDSYSAVWIEDINGNVVSKVIQKIGGADAEIVDFDASNIDQRSAVRVRSRSELFLNITSGESAEMVVNKLGEPEEVRKYGGNIFADKPPNVTFVYESLGSIQFSSQRSEAKYVELVRPIILKHGSVESISRQLETAKGQSLQNLAKLYYRRGQKDSDVLDVLAQTIWDKRETQNKYEIDAVSFLCKDLAQSNNSRYRTLLEDVAVQASASKIRKYAKSSLELLPTLEEAQFKPLE